MLFDHPIYIGDGSVTGASTVGAKDVELYAVQGGVPAKLIRYRFTAEQIEALLQIKRWDRSDEWLEENASRFTYVNDFFNIFRSLEETNYRRNIT